ncbi:hypothetical protein BDP27DRAFT_421725 [Rhodocollybia butyracea]|uniref:Uncharacterized protein n=1 Tax=Rhodocollybia butyracea TaxID=206335 RepID=A0A9P5PE39_9AGAR|nr:hypothetical protein BDP27DRAFT_421725 [Rhodocollybia butyracea]
MFMYDCPRHFSASRSVPQHQTSEFDRPFHQYSIFNNRSIDAFSNYALALIDASPVPVLLRTMLGQDKTHVSHVIDSSVGRMPLKTLQTLRTHQHRLLLSHRQSSSLCLHHPRYIQRLLRPRIYKMTILTLPGFVAFGIYTLIYVCWSEP